MGDSFERRVGVPVTAARQMIISGSDDHFRMALIILDGLAELLARRVIEENEFFLSIAESIKRESDHTSAAGGQAFPGLYPITLPSTTTRASLPDSALPYLTATQRRKTRAFDPAIDLATFFDAVSPSGAQALKDAHHFRNQAYHHDKTDGPSLAATVQVQAHAVAELLRGLQLTMRRILLVDEQDELRSSLQIPEAVPLTQAGLADYLVAPFDTATGAPGAFSASISWRVQGIIDALGDVSDHIGQSEETTLRLVQLDNPFTDDGSEIVTDRAVLDEWLAEAKSIARTTDLREALRRFRLVHEPLEDLSGHMSLVLMQVEQSIEREIDRRRGR